MCIRRKKLIFHVEFRMKSVKCIAISKVHIQSRHRDVRQHENMLKQCCLFYTDNADFQFMLSQAIINIF